MQRRVTFVSNNSTGACPQGTGTTQGQEAAVEGASGLSKERLLCQFWQHLGRRSARLVKGERNTVRQVGGDEMCNVFLLCECDGRFVGGDINAEE
eukprot:6172131-Pleurochrysis_carterae.AAC.2